MFEVLSVVGAVDARTRQLGGRELRCMRAGRRRVLCSATVHCDETTASSVSPTCCRSSADRARFCWSHRAPDPAGRGRGGVGGNTACAIAGGIGEDGLSFVGSVQQCRFGGRTVGVDGAWLAPSAAGAYPHRTWLDTCATKNGAGVRAARDHNDWRSTTWPEANQYRVNSSPRY